MKALIYEGPKVLTVQERPEPSPAAGQVKLKIRACGICGSDTAGYLGKTGRRNPGLVMGHEFAGEIVELGPGCTLGYQVGDKVSVQPKEFCGDCPDCALGYTNVCGVGKPLMGCIDVDGAFEEYLCVNEKLLYKMPENMTYLEGALIEPFAVAYGGVCKAGDLKGKNVLVVGGGTIGAMILCIVKTMGAKNVIVSDLSDARLETAKKLGADYTINPAGKDIKEEVKKILGGELCDVALEAVGITPTVQQAMAALKNRGTCVWVGNNWKMIEINMQEIVTQELTVRGTYIYTHKEFGEAMAFIAANDLAIDTIVSEVIPLEKAPELFDAIIADPNKYLKVVVTFD